VGEGDGCFTREAMALDGGLWVHLSLCVKVSFLDNDGIGRTSTWSSRAGVHVEQQQQA